MKNTLSNGVGKRQRNWKLMPWHCIVTLPQNFTTILGRECKRGLKLHH